MYRVCDQGSLNTRLYDRVRCAISSDGFTHLHEAVAVLVARDYTIVIILLLYLPSASTTRPNGQEGGRVRKKENIKLAPESLP